VEINPERTAILLLDVQNDLVAITPGIRQNRVLENIAAVLRAGRKAGAGIIHITASVRGDFRDIP
jgi:nicotinamidase-related amidase